ncbi:MAG: 50S ribosome-binding GTPase [Prolixibacteraceae bacterium]|jgi:[FeFe] hydrogenase H-cluster maturation GTPase HydF|nr:50S ribosome-binding GTPase [Prolixibacteraceae bacterium]
MTERDIIGIFGAMNAGKSSLMNLISQQESSIVDATPGTTADTRVTLMELHGIGPVKLMDTAGYDESDVLGEKKRKKVTAALKECDLVLLVINPSSPGFPTGKVLLDLAHTEGKQVLIVYNLFKEEDARKIGGLKDQLPDLKSFHEIALSALTPDNRPSLLAFLLQNYIPKNNPTKLLPFVVADEFYVLNIPMDEETPPGRYLRPQAMAEEYITRHWGYPVSYRMNLVKARANDIGEKARWESFLGSFVRRPKVIITDSQAMDIMKDWTPSDIGLTTFSIMMINYMSRGKLSNFANAVRTVDNLNSGDSILIAEACNHSRIKEDIGTVQIPNLIAKKFPEVKVIHLFGREWPEPEELKTIKLVIHCGGCMITPQRMATRLRDLEKLNIPITNYGIFLSYVQGKGVLEQVLQPWK